MQNMQLKTQRLCLIPLDYQQLINYLRLDNSLEKDLKLIFKERTIAPKLAAAFENRILPALKNPLKNYLFLTLWAIVDTTEKIMVGELCFKGEPNEKGEIEIGYGTYDDFQNNGYMTEALKEICKWAFEQEGVTTIIAKTDITNKSSQRILGKNSFIKIKESEMIEWQLTKAK